MDPADHAGAAAVMVLSHGLWVRGFGGDPTIIGRTLRTERASYTVIGVAPLGFTGTVEDDLVEFWIPVEIYEPASIIKDRTVRSSWMIGRLKPGATLASAQSELDAMRSYELSESIEFTVQDLVEAPTDQRLAMLERTAKSLTRWLLKDNPGVGIHEVSNRVNQFIIAVKSRVDQEETRLREE